MKLKIINYVLRVFSALCLLTVFCQINARQVVGSNLTEKNNLQNSIAKTIIIENVTIIDGTGKPAKSNMRVVVKGNRIESVEPVSPNSKIPVGTRLIDGKGKFLIPGLWDTHVHLNDIGEAAIPILPVYGITSVRDMGGDIPKLKNWRSQIENGKMIGPGIKFCGPMLEGNKESILDWRTDHWLVTNPQQARETVTKLANEGVDCIKMRTYANPETYFALAAAAKEHNLRLVGHAPWGIDPIQSSNSGQRSYEHGWYPDPWHTLTPEKKREVTDTFRKNGSLVVPTLIAWETRRFSFETVNTLVNDYEAKSDPRLKLVSASLRKNWLYDLKDLKGMNIGSPGWNKALDSEFEQIAEMHDNGVGMMVGTDSGAPLVFPGFSVHQELELLVNKCRFTPMDAILAATIIPAKFFGIEDQLGTIEKGKLADMVLLSANPLEEIANTKKIDGVILKGKWLDRKELDKITIKVEKRVAQSYKSNGMLKTRKTK